MDNGIDMETLNHLDNNWCPYILECKRGYNNGAYLPSCMIEMCESCRLYQKTRSELEICADDMVGG